MELALGALSGLAPKLAELLKDEYVKHKGLKLDIEALSRELLVMRAALVDTSRVPRDKLSEVDKVWARRVRDLAYDTEDAIDTFVLRAGGTEPASDDLNVFKNISRKAIDVVKNLKSRRQVIDKVKDIKNLSKELADLAKYRFSTTAASASASTGVDPRLLNMYKSEAELVGIEASRDELIRRLADGGSDSSLKIVSIVGFGGLGKTTLAKIVHDSIKAQFDCSAFVSVGRNPHITSVLKNLLDELDEDKYSCVNVAAWDYVRFCDELQKILWNKRFFIVIDDIWDAHSWKTILYSLSFKDSNFASRIIMTTRNFEVVTKDEDVYKLKPLSRVHSKILFNRRILSGREECFFDQSDELFDNILRKCGGVPLAIIAIASLLADKPWQEWSEVYNSMVSGHGDNTIEIISYSYNDLPSHLKPCLLYMSKYPEESKIMKSSLIWMWICEGFVQVEKEGDNMFEQGEKYLNQLINRSMIQPIEDVNDRSIRSCRVHDIVYDLICNLSREENFTTILVSEKHTSCKSVRIKEMGMSCSKIEVRRLSLQECHFEHIPHDTLGMPEKVRSVYITKTTIDAMPQLYRFQVCRLLSIQHSKIPNLRHIGKLLHLRYLLINNTHVDELPKEIMDLKALQTLILINIGLQDLPSTVCALTQLIYMEIIGFARLPANMIVNLLLMEELRLDPVAGRSETDNLVVQLGKLTRLRVLHIKFIEEMEESSQNALVNSIYSLEKIQDIKLSFPKSMNACAAWQSWVPPRKLWRLSIPDICFYCLPSWICPLRLPRLSNLAVGSVVVQEQDLENLAKLPELCYLLLKGLCINQGYTVGATDGFKKLRICNVRMAFKFLQGAMTSLEVLTFRVNVGYQRYTFDGVKHEILATKDAIGDLDLGLVNLLSLERVTIWVNCRGAFATDVEDAEAWLRHVVADHPKRPTIFIKRFNEDLILSDEHAKEVKRVLVRRSKDRGCGFADHVAFLRRYPRLKEVKYRIDCEGATLREVEQLEAALRKAVEFHRKRPTLQLVRKNADKMVSTSSGHCNTTEEGCRDDSGS